MNLQFDKNGISRSFSLAATTYDAWAIPQREIAKELLVTFPKDLPPGKIVDIGCGTGFLLSLLINYYPQRLYLGVDIASGMIEICKKRWDVRDDIEFIVDDADAFEMENDTCAMIASSSSFQWLENKEALLNKYQRMITQGGALAFAVPVSGSFSELKESFHSASDQKLNGLSLPNPEVYSKAIERAGFEVDVFQSKMMTFNFPTAKDVLRSFSKIGATFKHQQDYLPLPRRTITKAVEFYEKKYASTGAVPVTYNVLFCLARVIK